MIPQYWLGFIIGFGVAGSLLALVTVLGAYLGKRAARMEHKRLMEDWRKKQ